jgi:osmotically-inducible protein OsmY
MGNPLASRRLHAAVLLVAAAATLQGCIDALILGGAATGVIMATDRRQPEVLLGDQRIEIVAGSRIEDELKDRGHVNVTCYNYSVLLTGEVPNAEIKAKLERIASEVPQVKSVVNELQVAGVSSLASRSNDAYITGKVKGNLITAQVNNVKVVTEASVVYLLGLVTREEADAASDVARGTGGVQKVVRVFEYVAPPPPAKK